jgi:hypothetical protein
MDRNVDHVCIEIGYGAELYFNNWKRIVLHPIDTIKSVGSALWHPIRTVKAIGSQIIEHPIAMTVNFGLSWMTGHILGQGIDHVISSETGTTHIAGGSASSIVSQIVGQGGCGCGGICTSVASASPLVNQDTNRETEVVLSGDVHNYGSCSCGTHCPET